MKIYCPICGVDISEDYGHRCKQSTLDAIDAAMKRDPDDMLERKVPEGQKLYEGLEMLEEDDDKG